MYAFTGDPLDLGLIGLAELLPFVLIVLPALLLCPPLRPSPPTCAPCGAPKYRRAELVVQPCLHHRQTGSRRRYSLWHSDIPAHHTPYGTLVIPGRRDLRCCSQCLWPVHLISGIHGRAAVPWRGRYDQRLYPSFAGTAGNTGSHSRSSELMVKAQ